jgi:ParB family chromosome partitioning protein
LKKDYLVMAEKKSKRWLFSTNTAQSRQRSEILSRGTREIGTLHTDQVPLDFIEPDPANPRELPFGLVEVKHYLNTGEVPANSGESWEDLLALANTIQLTGVVQLISIYKHGNGYRIAAGERRYLASLLAGLNTIPARIYSERPRNLRLLQYVENFHREEPSLWGRVHNIREIINEWRTENPSDALTGERLGELVAASATQGRQYLALANAPEDIDIAIKSGRINNLDKAAMIARIEDPKQRADAMRKVEEGGSSEEIRSATKSTLMLRSSGKGRPKTTVQLGSVRKVEAIQIILTQMLGKEACSNVDWEDLGSVEAAWRQLIKELENRCQ